LLALAALVAAVSGASGKIGPKFEALLLREEPKGGVCEAHEASEATFAAGCFWSVELKFQRIPGVLSTQVGYTGGSKIEPSYTQVKTGETGHAEAVKVVFDPSVVSYRELVDVFFEIHNPTTVDRQGEDLGSQYRSVVFVHDDDQLREATESRKEAQAMYEDEIVTQIVPVPEWWPAEDYHQSYLVKGGQSAAKGDLTEIKCYG